MGILHIVLLVLLILWFVGCWRYFVLKYRTGEYNDGGRERPQIPPVKRLQPSTSGGTNNFNSGPPYPLEPFHPIPAQQTESATSASSNYVNFGPPYPLVPLHPMASDNNSNSTNPAIGIVIPSTSGECNDEGQEKSQIPPLKRLQPSTSGKTNSFNSDPPYPCEPVHPILAQQTESSTSTNYNYINSGPPYAFLPLHPMASDDNNSNSTNPANGFVMPSTSESTGASAPLQTPPPSYEVATSDCFPHKI